MKGKLDGVSREELIHYREDEGMTNAEIAEKFDCTPGAIYYKIGKCGQKRRGEQPEVNVYKTHMGIQPIEPKQVVATYVHKGIEFTLGASLLQVGEKQWDSVEEFVEYAIACAEIARFVKEEMAK